MLAPGHLIPHMGWAPKRKTDITEDVMDDLRDWAPTATPTAPTQEDDMFEQADRDMLKNIYNRTVHLDTAGMGALARLDADRATTAAARTANEQLVRQVLAAVSAAGVLDEKRDAAVLAAVAGIRVPDPEAFAAVLAPLLRAQGVNLDLATIVRAARLDVAAHLADPASTT